MNGWINITSCAGYLAAASLLELGHCKFSALQAGWLCVRSASWGTRGNLPARLERKESTYSSLSSARSCQPLPSKTS